MIVVDNDVISYFWIRMDVGRASLARDVRKKDDEWREPQVWRSEFRNVLRGYLAGGYMTLEEALEFADLAEADLLERTYSIPTAPVLELVAETGHSAYDCEYVALAQELDCRLVTGDQDLADAFSGTAVLMEDFVAEPS